MARSTITLIAIGALRAIGEASIVRLKIAHIVSKPLAQWQLLSSVRVWLCERIAALEE